MYEYIKPAFQTRPYKTGEVVAVKDRYQSFLYVKNGLYPIDMYVDNNENLVMIFQKNARSKELYDKYRRYELK